MKWKWSYFIGAAILAAYFLFSMGAPPVAVATGIVIGALLTRWASRSA